MKTNYEILLRLYNSIRKGSHIIFMSDPLPDLQSILNDMFGDSVYVMRFFRHDLTIVYYQRHMRGGRIRFTDLDSVPFRPFVSKAELERKSCTNLFNQCFYRLSTEETRIAVFYCIK